MNNEEIVIPDADRVNNTYTISANRAQYGLKFSHFSLLTIHRRALLTHAQICIRENIVVNKHFGGCSFTNDVTLKG